VTSDAPDTGYLPPLLNPFAQGFFDNPYEQYAAVREQDPVHLSPIGAWALFRYDDVVRVLRDPHLSVEERNAQEVTSTLSAEVQEALAARNARGSRAMLNLDPPDHHRLRRLVSKVFTPRMIESLRPRVQQLVDEHLDAVVERGTGTMDVIADLAFPLPFVVISEMLGIPEERDRGQLREWSGALVKTFDPIVTDDDMHAAMRASDNLLEYVTETIAWKRANPADDLLTALIAARETQEEPTGWKAEPESTNEHHEGDRLDEAELVDQIILLYVAGHETTVNLIGNGTLALLRNPDQLVLLRDDASLDVNAVEELLRYDSPVQMSRRITLEPFEIDGKEIEAGVFLMTSLGSANRDPRKFGNDAARLDLRRADANQHVSFGGGFHSCLGAHLARLEGQVALGTLVRRFPRLELATDTPEWNGRIVLRGLSRLPLAV
jgi:cytochrome P450